MKYFKVLSSASNQEYIIENEKCNLKKLAVFFLFSFYILPQYFGLELPMFDLTVQRFMLVIFFLYIINDKHRISSFISIFKQKSFLLTVLPFVVIMMITAVVRIDIGSILGPLIEIICLYMLIYIIKYILSIEEIIKLIIIFIYTLCIMGLIEYIIGYSPFSYLETISGLNTGADYRSGSIRIMGPCNHSLGYGLLLITAVPIVCLDFENDCINIFKNKILIFLVIINIFFTGSRSTLAVFGVEMILLFLFSNSQHKKRTFFILLIFVLLGAIFLIIFPNIGVSRYILLQLSSIVDELLGTSYSVNYGADVTSLSNSANYRDILLQIFSMGYVNPFLGRGSAHHFQAYINGYYIKSVDNFYINQYLKYAYTGLVTDLIFILSTLFTMLYYSFKSKSGSIRCMFIGTLCYFINLWWVDTLQTMKYAYLLIAIFFILYSQLKDESSKNAETISSKYFRNNESE